MGTTPGYGWPYPELSDPPDGPSQIRALAQAIENSMKGAIPNMQTGSVLVSASNVSAVTTSVTFPRPFPFTPDVITNWMASQGTTRNWSTRPIASSPTAFTIWTYENSGTAGTAAAAPVNWMAAKTPTVPIPASLVRSASPDGWHYVTATCHNPVCPNDDVAIGDVLIPDVPEEWGWTGIVCGACGEPITDIG